MRLSEIIEAMKETLGNKMDEEIEVNEPKPEPEQVPNTESQQKPTGESSTVEQLLQEIKQLKEENSKLASKKTVIDSQDDGGDIKKAIMSLCSPQRLKGE